MMVLLSTLAKFMPAAGSGEVLLLKAASGISSSGSRESHPDSPTGDRDSPNPVNPFADSSFFVHFQRDS
jgi:hypothetical protein